VTPEAVPEEAKPLSVSKPKKKDAQAAQSVTFPDQVLPTDEEPPKEPTKPCPDRDGKPEPVAFCNNLCTHREACPEWD
jgi:hypothetical protein